MSFRLQSHRCDNDCGWDGNVNYQVKLDNDNYSSNSGEVEL